MGNALPNVSAPSGSIRDMIGRLLSPFGGSSKRDHYTDFGWPKELAFVQLKFMFERNSLAKAAVERTVSKTWATNPAVWESEKPAQSESEKAIDKHFREINLWRALVEVDRRSLVGRYASFIMLLADNKGFHEPVETMTGDIGNLLGIIPCWEDQLQPLSYETNNSSPDYGKPTFFEFKEVSPDNPNSHRAVKVHASRVIIWSEEGNLSGDSILKAGFNDLIDAEKIRGAGGEGFWKTSRGALILEAPVGTKPIDVAKAMGTTVEGLHEKMNAQMGDFQQGFDKGAMLGGMTAKPLQISLPNPEPFHNVAVSSFAASVPIPMRVLLGNQTGERASTEDAREWAQTNMGRRSVLVLPVLRSFIKRLVSFGLLDDKDWTIGWDDLTDATPTEKLDRADKMADINTKTQSGDIPAFTPDEIREAAGFKTMAEVDMDPSRVKLPPTEEDLFGDGDNTGEIPDE